MTDLVEDLVTSAQASPGRRFLLGIAGAPGAGKSTLAAALVDHINTSRRPGVVASSLPMDGFHLSNDQLEARGLTMRKGAAETFDVHGFVALLARASHDIDHDVFVPDYDRRLHEPVAGRLVIPSGSRLVVVEGNYLALADGGWELVRPFLDRLWFLDTPSEVRRRRCLERQRDGGRTRAEAEAWVRDVDEPNARRIYETVPAADLVVRADEPDIVVPSPRG
jgi:pantothenate kinase